MRNRGIHRAFDALNRLYQITDPASGITTTSYDAHNRPLTVAAPTGAATAYVYNGFGDVIQESNPNTGTAVYYYDSTGNRVKRVAATGAVTQYAYDALDRVLTMTFPSDSAENVAYTYDQSGHGAGVGRLTSVSDAAGTLSRSYDQLGNLLTDARTTSTATLTTAYTYDAANRIASITYPSGTAVGYARDTMGRVTSVSAQPSGGASTLIASSVAYKPFGPDAGLRYGSAGQQTRSFDQDYRLTNVTDIGTVRRGLARVAENLSYAYYPTNNVQASTDAVNSANSQTFGYDNLQRLSNAAGGYGGFGFTYDGDGNRLSQTVGTTTTNYGYGSGSDLLTTISVGGVQTQAVGYTADGRIASLSPGIQAPGGQYITSLGYNQDARLSAVNASGGALASYTYDGFGQRLIKTISGTTGSIYQYGQNGMLLEETNASGVAQADYIYLDGRPVAVLNGSTLYYLHTDHLGTPQLATDSNQNIAWQATYQPFGQASVSGTITQNLRFPGQYFDLESSWNHNGFRDFAPELGRYIEPDPLGRAGSGNNLYVYAHNDPTNRSDPSGLWDTYTHHALLWNALKGCGMSNADIWQLQEESDFQDAWQFGGQDPGDAYMHSMASPGQSSQDALNAINGYIAQNLNSAAEIYQLYGDTASASNPTDTWLTPFGDALHTITDSTSPAHMQNGIPITWPSYPNASQHGDLPGSIETWANMTPALLQENIAMIQAAYMEVTGRSCGCHR